MNFVVFWQLLFHYFLFLLCLEWPSIHSSYKPVVWRSLLIKFNNRKTKMPPPPWPMIGWDIFYVLCNCWTEFNITFQEGRFQHPSTKCVFFRLAEPFFNFFSCPPQWCRGSRLDCGLGDMGVIPGIPSLHVGPLMARRLKTSLDVLLHMLG